MQRNEQGFTLTEIIVAVAVIAILAGALTPLVVKQVEKSRNSRTVQDLRAVKAAYQQYFADTGLWPCGWNANGNSDQHNDLATTYSCFYADDGSTGWDGPYLTENGGTSGGSTVMAQQVSGTWQGVLDPWGSPFRTYKRRANTSNAPNGTVVLYSKGRDGVTDTNTTNLLIANPTDDDIVMLVSNTAGG